MQPPPSGQLQPERKKPRERRVLIVAERTAGHEAFALIEAQRGGERLAAAGLEAEAAVTPPTRLGDDVVEDLAADAAAECRRCSAHRFDLTVIAREFL